MYNAGIRTRLHSLIKEKALKFGDFTLASGKKSTFYLDCRQITLDSEGVALVGASILEVIEAAFRPLPQAVGGMSIGADPITASVLVAAFSRRIPLKGFMVRKQPKDHGTGKCVEGPVQAGDHVVIVEDVVTTGGSSLEAIERVEAIGCIVDGVIASSTGLKAGKKPSKRRAIPFARYTLFGTSTSRSNRRGVHRHPIL